MSRRRPGAVNILLDESPGITAITGTRHINRYACRVGQLERSNKAEGRATILPQCIGPVAIAISIIIILSRPSKGQRSFEQAGVSHIPLVRVVILIKNITISSVVPPAGPRVKIDRDGITIIVHVHDGRPFRNDGLVRIKGSTMETGISLLVPIHTNIPSLSRRSSGIDVAAVLDDRIDRVANSPGQVHSFCKIISVTSYLLLPDDDRVVSHGGRGPLGVDFDALIEGVAKDKLVPIGAGRIFIPTAKGVAKALHLAIGTGPLGDVSGGILRAGAGGGRSGQDELGRVVGAALAVLVKDQPVTDGSIDGEGHVSGDGDDVAVVIAGALHIASDVGLALGNEPSLEVLLGGGGRIAHVDRIAARLLSLGDRERSGALGDLVLVNIVDLDLLEDSSVVGDGGICRDRIDLCHGCGTNTCDGEQRGL